MHFCDAWFIYFAFIPPNCCIAAQNIKNTNDKTVNIIRMEKNQTNI